MTHSRRHFIAAGVAGVMGLPTAKATQDLAVTPAQRIGPFYPVVGESESRVDLTGDRSGAGHARGTLIEVTGRVVDLHGRPLASALVLIWQADGAGRYDHPADAGHLDRDPGLAGHAVLRTARDGRFHITTVRPGAYSDDRSRSGLRTPHIHYEIIGEDARMITEMYFPNEPLNASDANIAEMIAAGADPNLLTARLEGGPSRAGATALRWDVVLSGR